MWTIDKELQLYLQSKAILIQGEEYLANHLPIDLLWSFQNPGTSQKMC